MVETLSPMLLQRYPVVERDTLTMTRPWVQWMHMLGHTVLPLVQAMEQLDALLTLLGGPQAERQALREQASELLSLRSTPAQDGRVQSQVQALGSALLAAQMQGILPRLGRGPEGLETLTVLAMTLTQRGAGRPLVAPPPVAAVSAIGPNLQRYAAEGHTHGITTGSFTITGTGFTDPDPTGTALYALIGPAVLLFIPTFLATSDATTFTLTGLPAAITPTQSSWDWPRVRDNSANAQLGALVFTAASTTITLHPTPAGSAGAAWTASGQKAHFPRWYMYALL